MDEVKGSGSDDILRAELERKREQEEAARRYAAYEQELKDIENRRVALLASFRAAVDPLEKAELKIALAVEKLRDVKTAFSRYNDDQIFKFTDELQGFLTGKSDEPHFRKDDEIYSVRRKGDWSGRLGY